MADLSPAAQAVYDAWYEAIDAYSEQDPPPQLAAALRAAVDQVVPGDGSRRSNEIRAELLAIADELEGING